MIPPFPTATNTPELEEDEEEDEEEEGDDDEEDPREDLDDDEEADGALHEAVEERPGRDVHAMGLVDAQHHRLTLADLKNERDYLARQDFVLEISAR